MSPPTLPSAITFSLAEGTKSHEWKTFFFFYRPRVGEAWVTYIHLSRIEHNHVATQEGRAGNMIQEDIEMMMFNRPATMLYFYILDIVLFYIRGNLSSSLFWEQAGHRILFKIRLTFFIFKLFVDIANCCPSLLQ